MPPWAPETPPSSCSATGPERCPRRSSWTASRRGRGDLPAPRRHPAGHRARRRAGAGLAPADIARLLDDRFRLLSGGRRSSLERHRTLRADGRVVVRPARRRWPLLFARLSVFTGWFNLDAARAIARWRARRLRRGRRTRTSRRAVDGRRRRSRRRAGATACWRRSASTASNASPRSTLTSSASAMPTTTVTGSSSSATSCRAPTSSERSPISTTAGTTCAPPTSGPSTTKTPTPHYGSAPRSCGSAGGGTASRPRPGPALLSSSLAPPTTRPSSKPWSPSPVRS